MQQRAVDLDLLRSFGDRLVRVRLEDGSHFAGRFRVELLSERSISVFLQASHGGPGDGVTLYVDTIVAIDPVA